MGCCAATAPNEWSCRTTSLLPTAGRGRSTSAGGARVTSGAAAYLERFMNSSGYERAQPDKAASLR